MRVSVTTRLPCSLARAWIEVQRPVVLQDVARPLARIEPVDAPQFPDVWESGQTYRCRSYLFGVLPVGTRRIVIERIDPLTHTIQSRESDALVKTWDHRLALTIGARGETTYQDVIEIDAGLLTPLVWGWAQWFYRHRQGRWRRLAALWAAAERDQAPREETLWRLGAAPDAP